MILKKYFELLDSIIFDVSVSHGIRVLCSSDIYFNMIYCICVLEISYILHLNQVFMNDYVLYSSYTFSSSLFAKSSNFSSKSAGELGSEFLSSLDLVGVSAIL